MVVTALAVSAAAWGTLMGISPILQIRRMIRQRSSRDVSIGYFTVLLIGFVIWVSYGIAERNPVLIVPNAVALLVGVGTIVVAFQLGRGSRGTGQRPLPEAAAGEHAEQPHQRDQAEQGAD
jgi:uncharacterized protein with PQ loop repeat